jgi:predicted nucleic acid-binding protein
LDLLLDTSALYAVADPRDRHHSSAREFLRRRGLRFHTTTNVIGETFTIIRRREGYGKAIRFAHVYRQTQMVAVHHPTGADDTEIWAVIAEYSGVPLSYVDAGLLVLGRRLQLSSLFGFDEDFRLAGLRVVPD